MTDHARARKLADRIKVVVAETLERQVKDPRLGFITITDARVTGDDSARQETAAALESARGVLRSEVGKQTQVRFTPTLTFILDGIQDNVQHIDDLLARAREADAA